MKVILLGATGMVGQGVLRECLLDPEVESVLTIGRNVTGQNHAKLKEIVQKDLMDYSGIEEKLSGYDACFFCLGISSLGKSEEDYTRVTYGYAMAAAKALMGLNPQMIFEYVSGTGTDSTEQGRTMWARVKGKTENELLGLAFRGAYMFRPAYIQPLHGVKSKTDWYQVIYAVMAPLYPVWKALLPDYVTSTEQVGKAMIAVAKHGAAKRVLENRDINELGS
jgi:uncharacterized protein YbjT (DUF2867 family)